MSFNSLCFPPFSRHFSYPLISTFMVSLFLITSQAIPLAARYKTRCLFKLSHSGRAIDISKQCFAFYLPSIATTYLELFFLGEKGRGLVNWLREQPTLPPSCNNEYAINKPQEQTTTTTWIEVEVPSLTFSGLTRLKVH